ncbi:uncharacterized protein LOC101236630 isoform X1 [Hydra vulgaris]|uniref:uncharacterized protein LOC101236630 isoform X1 n=1 Tax=Hydra vulgaris TaxID=6087 RepID=UPI001F5F38FC|nr:uncharacterized protein LOC101236630 isoform X1 [Hydra vulgaris]
MQMVDLNDSLKQEIRCTDAKDLPADILAELSFILNPPLIGKDFRNLAGKMKKSFQVVRWLEMQKDPTASLLEHWWSDNGSRTVEDLIVLLKEIQRFDAVKLLEPHTHYIVRSRPPSTVSTSSKEPTEHDSSEISFYRSTDRQSICNTVPSELSTVTRDEGDPDDDLNFYLQSEEDEKLLRKISGPCETKDIHPIYIYNNLKFSQSDSSKSLSASSLSTKSPSASSSTISYCTDFYTNAHNSQAAQLNEVNKLNTVVQQQQHKVSLTREAPPIVNQKIISNESTAVVASDKIALLIGNRMYRHRSTLCNPSKDVEALTIALRELGFKVLSLVDLNLTEMRTVMLSFCKLLGPGVFAVFYFAGHGFEENGENFLIPVDASPYSRRDEFIAAQEVLREMQLRETALNLCIIDACRVIGNELNNSDASRSCRLGHGSSGNTIVAYSCQPATQAYEIVGEENGVYMTELLKHIKRDCRIEHILMDVNTAVNRNPIITQRPVFETDSADDCRLTCKIDGHANNALWQSKRFDMWSESSIPPEPQIFKKNEESVIFMFTYQALFSNKLRINIFMKNFNEQPLELYDVQLLNGSDLVIIDKPICNIVRPSNDEWTEIHDFIIKDIQKITSNLLLVFQLKYRKKTDTSDFFPLELKIDAGFPLISAHFREFHKWICEENFPGHKNTWV